MLVVDVVHLNATTFGDLAWLAVRSLKPANTGVLICLNPHILEPTSLAANAAMLAPVNEAILDNLILPAAASVVSGSIRSLIIGHTTKFLYDGYISKVSLPKNPGNHLRLANIKNWLSGIRSLSGILIVGLWLLARPSIST